MSTQTPTTALGSAGKTPEQTASGTENFASLFEASLIAGDFGKEGEIVKGTVVAVQRDNVVIDIGGKSEGIIALSEFADASLPPGQQITVKPGDDVDVYIESRENDDGLVTLSKEKADKMKVWDEISAACERDELIEGTISQRVKGGLSVTIRGGVKAFLPGSQVDLRPIRNLDKLIGQTYQFKVIKFNKKRGNIVLSRARASREGARRAEDEDPRDPRGGQGRQGRHQEHHRVRRVRRSRRHRRPAPHHRHELGPGQPPVRALPGGRRGHRPRPQVQPRDRARVARPQADPGRPLEPRRRGVPAGQEGPRQGAVDHRLRRVRRARAGRRGPHPRQRDVVDQEGQAPEQGARGRARRSSARCSRSTRRASASASA